MRVVTVKMPEDLLEELDRYAINRGMSRSEAVRIAVECLLKTSCEEIPQPPTLSRLVTARKLSRL